MAESKPLRKAGSLGVLKKNSRSQWAKNVKWKEARDIPGLLSVLTVRM